MNNSFKRIIHRIYLYLNNFKSSSVIFKLNYRVVRPLMIKYFDATYHYHGIKVVLNPTRFIDSGVIRGNDHDPIVTEYIEKLIHSKSDLFIDIGANFGLFSLIAGKKGTVYAFEHSMRENSRFYKNILSNNGSVTIFPYPAAIGKKKNETGKLFLGAESNTGTNSLVVDNGYGFVEVNFIELGEVLNDELIKRIKLIKIDVEGFEPEVIDSIAEVLVKISHCTLIVEVTRNEGKTKNMYELIGQCGFKPLYGVDSELDQYNEIFTK